MVHLHDRLITALGATRGDFAWVVEDPATGVRSANQPDVPFPGASTLKLAVFVRLLQLADSGTIRLDAPALDTLRQSITVPFILDRASPETTLANAPTYLPANPTDAASTLTVRDHYWDRPTPIARTRWRFISAGAGPPRLALDGGFEPGRMYEVSYVAMGARLVGAGLAAIRDAASAFRYRTDLPIRGRWALGYGFSQDGRFLRQFLYDGFNVDEQIGRAHV